jgi:hypothetical protein
MDKTLFHCKHQQEAFGSQVETLIKKKKEKTNVLINFKLSNLKSAFMFNFEKLRRRIAKAKQEKLVEANKEYQRNLQ